MSEKFFLDDEVETVNLTNVQKCDIICTFKKGGYIMRMDLDKNSNETRDRSCCSTYFIAME